MALLGQIAPESAGPEQAQADLDRARAAAAELDTAAELEPDSPPKRLQDEVAEIVARLELATGELRSVDADEMGDLAAARDAEITDRCLAIVWERRDPTTRATPEDDAFWTRNDCARRVQEFIQVLRAALPKALNVHEHDERFTTAEAERVLIAADVSRSKRKDLIDQQAAALILQGWLDARSRSG